MILSTLIHTAEGPHSKSSDQRIRILTVTILNECVHSHDDGHVGLELGIVYQADVDTLLQL